MFYGRVGLDNPSDFGDYCGVVLIRWLNQELVLVPFGITPQKIKTIGNMGYDGLIL